MGVELAAVGPDDLSRVESDSASSRLLWYSEGRIRPKMGALML